MAEVETQRDGAVLTITLNRPDVLNAFNGAMHKALGAALKEARDDEVRAVVITGAGRGFCVGQDLTEFRDAAGDIGDRLRSTYHPNILAIRALEKPVIAAVNGAAAGAGMSFACACDIRIASDAAVFVPAFVNIGLVPDSGGTFFVTRLLGYARAFEWLCSGRRLSAAEAHAWGLVSEVVEAERSPARAAELAAELAALPTKAIGMTKRLLDRAGGFYARRAAGVGGAAPGGGDADRGLRGGSAGISGEAEAELQGPVADPSRIRFGCVVDDDLRRSRLTVFFRLLLVIPHLSGCTSGAGRSSRSLVFNWFATLFAGRSEADVQSFIGRWVRYATHVYAYMLLAANPYPRFSGKPGTYPIDLEIDPPEPQPRLITLSGSCS